MKKTNKTAGKKSATLAKKTAKSRPRTGVALQENALSTVAGGAAPAHSAPHPDPARPLPKPPAATPSRSLAQWGNQYQGLATVAAAGATIVGTVAGTVIAGVGLKK
jgi:hypothetical protein